MVVEVQWHMYPVNKCVSLLCKHERHRRSLVEIWNSLYDAPSLHKRCTRLRYKQHFIQCV